MAEESVLQDPAASIEAEYSEPHYIYVKNESPDVEQAMSSIESDRTQVIIKIEPVNDHECVTEIRNADDDSAGVMRSPDTGTVKKELDIDRADATLQPTSANFSQHLRNLVSEQHKIQHLPVITEQSAHRDTASIKDELHYIYMKNDLSSSTESDHTQVIVKIEPAHGDECLTEIINADDMVDMRSPDRATVIEKLEIELTVLQPCKTDSSDSTSLKTSARFSQQLRYAEGERDNMHREQDNMHREQDNMHREQLSEMTTRTKKRTAGELPFTCYICRKRFEFRSKLYKHLNTHSDQRPHGCNVCSKRFRSKSNLTDHLNVHADKLHSCDVCSKSFASKRYLVSHKKIHDSELSLSCDVCHKGFTSKINLANHTIIHTGERPQSCDVCGKRFATKCNLAKHKRIHTGERPYSCDVCSKKFTSKCSLINHLKIHSGERVNICDICNKRFITKFDLIGHLRMHTGERPHGCEICGKRFAMKSHLFNHLKIHTGQCLHGCAICSKRLTSKHNLGDHLKSHASKLPHSCNVCSKPFAFKSTLARHVKTHARKRHHGGDDVRKKGLPNTL